MTFPLRSLLLFPLFLFFAVAMMACDSTGSNDSGDNGSPGGSGPSSSDALMLTIKDTDGNTIKTIQSYSFFSTTTDSTGSTAFAVFFTDEETFSESNTESGFFGSAVRMSTRPAVQQYAASSVEDSTSFLNGETFLISFSEVSGSQSSTFYSVESGTIDITRSESSRVDGDLSLQGKAITFDGTQSQQSIEITGSFRASSLGTFNFDTSTASIPR